ncbi:hypothetical protein Fmac_027476 [Flemingia macrophylla]|uniref:Uncharacterized protein n=1 Tax=Flemingia macrophylla TaxID=520843 RepID=A0ABD1LHT0_9FABA
MESLRLSSPNVASLTNGGNLWLGRHSKKNIYYPSSYASKPLLLRGKIQGEYKFLKFRKSNLNHSYKYIGGGSTQENNGKYILKVTSGPHANNVEPHVSYNAPLLDLAKKILAAFILCF